MSCYDPEIYDEAEFKRVAPASVVQVTEERVPDGFEFCQYLVDQGIFSVTYEDPKTQGDVSFYMEGNLTDPPCKWESSVERD